MIDFQIKQWPTELRHSDEGVLENFSVPQSRDDKYAKQKCSKIIFQRTISNKEKLDYSWLCFSTQNGKIYCFSYTLFAEECESQFINCGSCDWKHALQCSVLLNTESQRTTTIQLQEMRLVQTIMLVQIGPFNNKFVVLLYSRRMENGW